jgi:peptidyl-prolyl cis-trans isomerase D
MADLGLSPREELDQTRNAFLPATPAGFTAEVFEMATGDVRIMEGKDTIVIVQLDAITPADENNAEAAALVAGLRGQQNEALARGLFDIFSQDTLMRAGQTIDPRAVSAVNVSFQ